jgi:hypothetical protein
MNLKLTLANTEFDELQAQFTAELVERIKLKLQEAGIENSQLEDLTAGIALSIAGVIDDVAEIQGDGVEVHPYLTFRAGDEELIHCGENANTYDQVYDAMQTLFRR